MPEFPIPDVPLASPHMWTLPRSCQTRIEVILKEKPVKGMRRSPRPWTVNAGLKLTGSGAPDFVRGPGFSGSSGSPDKVHP